MYLVTGGSGYFGEVMVQKLLEKGKKVRIFDLNPPNTYLRNKVEVFIGDITNISSINEACKNIDCVFHNVAQVPLAKNEKLFYKVNYSGTDNLLKCVKRNRVSKVVYTSSSAVFGVPKTNPVNENTKPTPKEPYGKAKYDAELLCEHYNKLGFNISIVRPRTIVGGGRLGVFSILFDWVSKGYNIPVLNNGSNIYQFIHVEDLAEICWKLSQRNNPEICNAGATKYYTMRETLQGLCDHANTGSKVKNLPMYWVEKIINILNFFRLSPLGTYHSLMYGRSLYFDNSKVKNTLKYITKYDNIEALCHSYDFYVKNIQIDNNKGKSIHQRITKQKILGLLKYFL